MVTKAAILLTFVLGTSSVVGSPRQQWPEWVSRRRVSVEFLERARQWRVVNFAHALAAEGIPAGVVLEEDQEAVGLISRPVQQVGLLATALDAFMEKRTDYEVLMAGSGLVFRPRGGACNASLDRTVPAFVDEGPLNAVIQRIVRKASGVRMPNVPPGIVGSIMRGEQVREETRLPTRPVVLRSTKPSTVAALLNQVVAQVPGVVWGLWDHRQGSTPCNVTLFTPNTTLVTSDELK